MKDRSFLFEREQKKTRTGRGKDSCGAQQGDRKRTGISSSGTGKKDKTRRLYITEISGNGACDCLDLSIKEENEGLKRKVNDD